MMIKDCFATAPDLESICLSRFHCGRRKGDLYSRNSTEPTTNTRSLPVDFEMHGAPPDRNGHFMLGIPNAFRPNRNDDDGDTAYAERQEKEYEKIVKEQDRIYEEEYTDVESTV